MCLGSGPALIHDKFYINIRTYLKIAAPVDMELELTLVVGQVCDLPFMHGKS